MFNQFVEKEKIHIVPNFADDYLFTEEETINTKFAQTKPLTLLYLSNMIHGKGYQELVEAYISLHDSYKDQIHLSFVGGFREEKAEEDFTNLIKPYNQITYLGKFIDGENKKKLYEQTHIFCLPTYYPFEGQPISIIEAYATGCVVITTAHSGIPYIFTDKKNGYIVEKKSVNSIKETIEYIVDNQGDLHSIALFNKRESFVKYRALTYQNSINKILIDVNS
jgi:glycosyltransferase involved in cell wall biosynthesis